MAKRKKKTTKTVSQITYEGKVKVQLLHGKKAYKTFENKNKGTKYMFNFLANCLAGNFYDSQKPLYIRLYQVVLDDNGNESGSVNDRTEVTTTAIPARAISVGGDIDKAEVRYEFLIPAATLGAGAANLLALFSFNEKNNAGGAAAEVILSDTIEKEDGTTNIRIEWTLILGNKVEE